MGKYTLDYFSKYYFYEEDEFLKEVEEGEYILEQIKKSNRFDYKGHSYKYTKFKNISKSNTKRDVEIEIPKDDIDVIINGEVAHLDLIYKFDTKELEDHIRITTRISIAIVSRYGLILMGCFLGVALGACILILLCWNYFCAYLYVYNYI
jgi:hypothetical protein